MKHHTFTYKYKGYIMKRVMSVPMSYEDAVKLAMIYCKNNGKVLIDVEPVSWVPVPIT